VYKVAGKRNKQERPLKQKGVLSTVLVFFFEHFLSCLVACTCFKSHYDL